jgi:hypothetical protein
MQDLPTLGLIFPYLSAQAARAEWQEPAHLGGSPNLHHNYSLAWLCAPSTQRTL